MRYAHQRSHGPRADGGGARPIVRGAAPLLLLRRTVRWIAPGCRARQALVYRARRRGGTWQPWGLRRVRALPARRGHDPDDRWRDAAHGPHRDACVVLGGDGRSGTGCEQGAPGTIADCPARAARTAVGRRALGQRAKTAPLSRCRQSWRRFPGRDAGDRAHPVSPRRVGGTDRALHAVGRGDRQARPRRAGRPSIRRRRDGPLSGWRDDGRRVVPRASRAVVAARGVVEPEERGCVP